MPLMAKGWAIENLLRGLRLLSRRGMRIVVGEGPPHWRGVPEQRRARLTRDPGCGTLGWHLNANDMFGGLCGEGLWVRRVPCAWGLRPFEVLCCGDSVQYLST